MSGGMLFHPSLTRISDLAEHPYQIESLPLEDWSTSDYVVGQIHGVLGFKRVELTTGRLCEVARGDLLVGALGDRHATFAVCGSWRDIEADGYMDAMTMAGLIGRVTSRSQSYGDTIHLRYQGHVVRGGRKVSMLDFVPNLESQPWTFPTVLIVGTSMSSGKTTAAKLVIRQLKEAGVRVVGCKLTGAGRYRDILGMQDAGADQVFDFVDAGLPSSIVPREDYRERLRVLLARVAMAKPDVVVAEAGASPLEPYNGDTLLEEIGSEIQCTILCASDPYAVVGVIQGFERLPDLVAGLATSTLAGIQLVERLTKIRGLNVLDPDAVPELRTMLAEHLPRLSLAERWAAADFTGAVPPP